MKRLLSSIFGLTVVAVVFLFPFVALAQEAVAAPADPTIGGGWDIAATIYTLVAGLLATGMTWLGAKLSKWISTKTKNEMVGGILGRFTESVFTAVKHVMQTLRSEIEKAKDPKSPGGAKITEGEAAKLKEAVWSSLKEEYGGMDGIGKFLAVLGISGGEDGIKKWVDTKIESAVHDVKAVSNPK